MGDYFKPLRRKIGVMMLLVACVFAAGWMRSQFIQDSVSCSFGGATDHAIFSVDRHIAISIQYGTNRDLPFVWPRWNTLSETDIEEFFSYPDFSKHPDISWKWRSFCFSMMKIEWSGSSSFTWVIPYWAIISPLILLSAWLLLSKPTPAKTTADSLS